MGLRRLPLGALAMMALLPPLPSAAQGAVCQSARQCADIVRRHDAGEFDYAVLAREVARLGGEREVLRLLGDGEAAGHVLRLAAEPGASAALRDGALRAWPRPDVEAQLRLMRRVRSPVVREVALRSMPDPDLREAAVRALATQTQPWDPRQAARHFDALEAAPAHPETARALGAVPGERGAAALVRMLGSGEAEAVAAAFAELRRLDGARAERDLRAAVEASPPARAGAYARAVEMADEGVPGFDAAGFGFGLLRDRALPPHVRAVGLHSALLEPAREGREVAGDVGALLPILLAMPPSERLADTAPSHRGMQSARALRSLLGTWQGRDTEAAAGFARALGRVRPSPARPLLRDLYGTTSDYRVQLAAVEALAAIGEDGDWIAAATRGHPLRAVERAGAAAVGRRPVRVPAQCRPEARPRAGNAARLPYFESGRYRDGRPARRWELVDAQPVPGGWLAGYERGLLRYGSGDTSEATPITGRVAAILPDVEPEPGRRARVFWVVEEGPDVARLHRYGVDAEPVPPVTLPKGVRVVRVPDAFRASARGWALEFGGEQPTLLVDRAGRLRRLCSVREQ